ncbi:MAG TPA: PqqD family protein [Gaiellaceae bacterium]|nr:PqqD family protein [Gaiellaceae bacterium]
MGGDLLPRPVPDVVYRELEGEMVLVHLGTNRIYSLNETGAKFWERLAAGDERAEIERLLLAEFKVEPAELRQEIDSMLQALAEEGLVAGDSPPAPAS